MTGEIEMPSPSYVFFDFDKTLICKDSFKLLFSYLLKKSPHKIINLLLFLPFFIILLFFVEKRKLFKSYLLFSVTFLENRRSILKKINSFGKTQNGLWFQEAILEMEKIQKENYHIVIVSASGQKWIRSLFQNIPIKPKIILGSRLKYCFGGILFSSYNCRSEKKLWRIKELGLSNLEWAKGYSDHPDDIPFLKICKERYLISPKKKHLETFQKEINLFQIKKWSLKKYFEK